MIDYVVLLLASGAALSLFGIALVVASLMSAARRGERVGGRLWAPRAMFVGKELARNRGGFWLSVAGIVVMVAALALALYYR
jgi:hypothetical protein